MPDEDGAPSATSRLARRRPDLEAPPAVTSRLGGAHPARDLELAGPTRRCGVEFGGAGRGLRPRTCRSHPALRPRNLEVLGAECDRETCRSHARPAKLAQGADLRAPIPTLRARSERGVSLRQPQVR